MLDRTELIPVHDGERRSIGPFDCQFIPVTHSVPHGFAIAFFTPVGHDHPQRRLQARPHAGRRAPHRPRAARRDRQPRRRRAAADVRLDERRAARVHAVGVDGRRRDAVAVPRAIPTSGSSSRASRRTCTACSRSRRPRSRTVARSRSSAGRWSRTSRWRASSGCSTSRRTRSSTSTRRPRYAPGEVCIVCTGSQGEPMSALSLMAAHEHKHVKVSPDDVVVISAHAIPGNESNVSRVIDSLHRAGAEVVHDRNVAGARVGPRVAGGAEVPAQPAPARVVRAGARRVPAPRAPRAPRRATSVSPRIGCSSAKTATSSRSRPTAATSSGARCPPGYMYVDGIVGDIGHGVLRDRRVLAEEGVVVVIVTVDTQDRRGRDRPRDRDPRLGLRARGRGPPRGREGRRCGRRSQEATDEGATDLDTLRRHARRSLGRFIDERTQRRPIVIPVVMEVLGPTSRRPGTPPRGLVAASLGSRVRGASSARPASP